MKKDSFLKRSWLVMLCGVVIGIAALVLQKLGNPGNMGFCIACFERDIAGALGLHRAGQKVADGAIVTGNLAYFRPEIIGILLGSMLMAICAKEFKGRSGSSPVLRFVLGAGVMIGALVFLGCPLRMVLRIGGGDPNALLGLVGFIAGILVGVLFLKKGFTLRRSYNQSKPEAAAFPVATVLMGALCLLGVIGLMTTKGTAPGGARAPWYVSIIAGLVVGALGQRSRFCMAGGVRDAVMFKDFSLVTGSVMIILTVLVGNLILGNFGESYKGFVTVGQPIASADGLWNFLGMAIVGWGSALLGGCPLRQLVLTGEGNTDSAVTVLGMIAGAALAHNFGLASGASTYKDEAKTVIKGGSTKEGHVAVIVILVLLAVVSVVCTFFQKKEKAK